MKLVHPLVVIRVRLPLKPRRILSRLASLGNTKPHSIHKPSIPAVIVHTSMIARITSLISIMTIVISLTAQILAIISLLEEQIHGVVLTRSQARSDTLGFGTDGRVLHIVDDQPVSRGLMDREVQFGVLGIHRFREEDASVCRVEFEDCVSLRVSTFGGGGDFINVPVSVFLRNEVLELFFDVLGAFDIEALVDEVDCVLGGSCGVWGLLVLGWVILFEDSLTRVIGGHDSVSSVPHLTNLRFHARHEFVVQDRCATAELWEHGEELAAHDESC